MRDHRLIAWFQGWAATRKGGPGSGNWAHKGRPGMRGGSVPGGGKVAAHFRALEQKVEAAKKGELVVSYAGRSGTVKIGQEIPVYGRRAGGRRFTGTVEKIDVRREAAYIRLPAGGGIFDPQSGWYSPSVNNEGKVYASTAYQIA